MLDLFQVALDVVLPVPEYVHAAVGSCGVSLAEHVGRNLIHIFPILGVILLVLIRINLRIIINGFLLAINGDQIDIKSDVEQLVEFSLRLLLQVELSLVVLLRVR